MTYAVEYLTILIISYWFYQIDFLQIFNADYHFNNNVRTCP